MGDQAGTGAASVCIGEPVPSRPQVIVRPVRLTLWDDAQHTNVSKPIGYRAKCSCGWKGRIHRKRPVAVSDMNEHRDSH